MGERAGRWDEVTVDGSVMRCYLASPEDGTTGPGVIVIHHAGGVDEFTRGICDRFAQAGFVALAPDLYHRDANVDDDPLTRMGRLRDAEIVRDCDAAVEHLKGLDDVAGERIGVTGFCMGGRVAYLAAAHNASFGAVVVFYGGNIMVAWGEGEAPFDRTEGIACPVLGLFGEDDTNPSPSDVAKLDAELSRLGKEHEFHSYAGAGHAFMNWLRPSYREDTAEDAWTRCVGWFRRCLA